MELRAKARPALHVIGFRVFSGQSAHETAEIAR
jgi:hypothetical protein